MRKLATCYRENGQGTPLYSKDLNSNKRSSLTRGEGIIVAVISLIHDEVRVEFRLTIRHSIRETAGGYSWVFIFLRETDAGTLTHDKVEFCFCLEGIMECNKKGEVSYCLQDTTFSKSVLHYLPFLHYCCFLQYLHGK